MSQPPTNTDLGWDDRGSLPLESDFDPIGGGLDEQWAWKEFGGLTLRDAFEKFRLDASRKSERLMFMGDRAFAFHYPVIERYLREFARRGSRDDGPMSDAWILGKTVAYHFEPGDSLSNTEELAALKPTIRELARWITDHLPQFTMDSEEQHQITQVWNDLETTLGN